MADFELRIDELLVLEEACRVLGRLEKLQEMLSRTPPLVKGSTGQVRANPLLAEQRSEVALLARLLGQLGLPGDAADDEDGNGNPAWDGLSTSARGRKAARSRWDHRGGAR